jgi:hypothetical protein
MVDNNAAVTNELQVTVDRDEPVHDQYITWYLIVENNNKQILYTDQFRSGLMPGEIIAFQSPDILRGTGTRFLRHHERFNLAAVGEADGSECHTNRIKTIPKRALIRMSD